MAKPGDILDPSLPPFWERRNGGGPITDRMEAEPKAKAERVKKLIALRQQYWRMWERVSAAGTRDQELRVNAALKTIGEELHRLDPASTGYYIGYTTEDFLIAPGKRSYSSSIDADTIRPTCSRKWLPSLDHYDRQAPGGGQFFWPLIPELHGGYSPMDRDQRSLPDISSKDPYQEPYDMAGSNSVEKDLRDLLEECGAVFVRLTSNDHERWELPNGKPYTCSRPGRAQRSGIDKELATLRRLLNGSAPRGTRALTREEAEAALKASRLAKKAASRKVPAVHPQRVEAPPEPEPNFIFEEPAMVEPIKRNPLEYDAWTDGQLELLKCGIDSDMEYKDIAKELESERPGITASAVSQKAKKMGWKRPRALGNQTPAEPEPSKVRRPKSWSDAEDELLLECLGKGMLIREIPEVLNPRFHNDRSKGSVGGRISALRKSGVEIPDGRALTDSAPEPTRQKIPESRGECTLYLAFPDGREVKVPISQRSAEELALKILTGELK